MNRRISLMLVLLLLCVFMLPVPAGGEISEEEVDLDDLLNIEIDEIEEFAVWNFPVALEDMNPEYIRLVNNHYMLEPDYVPEDLVKLIRDPNSGASKGGVRWDVSQSDGKYVGQYLREECAQALYEMNAVMRSIDGFKVMYVKSSYRSFKKQRDILGGRKDPNDGWVAKPGCSDHQTGLGCDFIPYNWTKQSGRTGGMNDKMMKEKECQWMAEHCQEYGFIIRYPMDKKELTEINMEPWHLRYVGIPAATYIMENNLCLEEFTEQLQAAIQEYLAAGGNLEKVQAFIQEPYEYDYKTVKLK